MTEQEKDPFEMFSSIQAITGNEDLDPDFSIPKLEVNVDKEETETIDQEQTSEVREGEQEDVLNEEEVDDADSGGTDGTDNQEIEQEVQEISFTPLLHAWAELNGWDTEAIDSWAKENGRNMDSFEDFNEFINRVIADSAEGIFANDEVKTLNEYVRSGGSVKDFYNQVYNVKGYKDIVIKEDNESQQENIYRDYLKATTPWTDAKINKEIKRLIDAEELFDEAKEALEFLKENESKAAEKALAKQKEQEAEQLKLQQQALLQKKQEVMSIETFAGFEANPSKKEALFKYYYERDPKTGMTGFEKKLKENPTHFWDIMFMSMEGINKDKVAKKLETKVTQDLVNKLSGPKDPNARTGSSVNEIRKKPADEAMNKFLKQFAPKS